MPDGLEIQISGLDRVDKAFKDLEWKVKKRVLKKAVRSGLKPVHEEVKNAAPKDTKSLSRAFKISVDMKPAGDRVTGNVKVDKKRSYQTGQGRKRPIRYMHFVTLGTRPHRIGKGKIRGEWKSDIAHPGQRANDFLDRVYVQKHREMIAEFNKRYGEEVAKEARMLGLMAVIK